MKADTPDLIKFKDLQRLLGKPAYAITGVLEALWITTAKNAFMGDIGRHNNRQIANALEWDGDADELVAALVESGWLDKVDGDARLVIHDWYDNAAQYIVQKIHRKLGVTRDTLKEHDGHMHAREMWAHAVGLHMYSYATHSDARPPRARTLPIPSQPNPSPPSLSEPASTPVDAEWAEAAAELLKVGVGTAESVLLGCRRRDVQPIDVRRVLSHWRAKAPAWEVGGLVYRLANLRHGQDPADPNLWPPPSKAAKQSETTADRERVAAEAKRQRDEGEQRKREAAEHAKRLERDHGPATNKLDRAAMEAILNERMKNWRRLYHLPDSGKLSEGAIRHELLSHFDSQTVKA